MPERPLHAARCRIKLRPTRMHDAGKANIVVESVLKLRCGTQCIHYTAIEKIVDFLSRLCEGFFCAK